MRNEQKLSQYVDQLFLYTTEKTNVKPSCHAKADIGSLIEDEAHRAVGAMAVIANGPMKATCTRGDAQNEVSVNQRDRI